MAIININTLKQKFLTGRRPQQQDFHDLIDTAIMSAGGGVTALAPTDTMPPPTGTKRYIAVKEGYYNNLKLANGSAAATITVTANDMQGYYVFLDYSYTANAWEKHLTNINGPKGDTGAPGPQGVPGAITNASFGPNLLENGLQLFYPDTPGSGTGTLITNDGEPYYRYTPNVDKAVMIYGSGYNYDGGEYVVSARVRVPVSMSITMHVSWMKGVVTATISANKWTYIRTTPFFNPEDIWLWLSCNLDGVPLDVKDVMIQRGNVPFNEYVPPLSDFNLKRKGTISAPMWRLASGVASQSPAVGNTLNYDGTYLYLTNSAGATKRLKLEDIP